MIRPISEGDAWVTNDDGDIIGIQLHGRSEIVDLSNPVNGKVNPITGKVKTSAGGDEVNFDPWSVGVGKKYIALGNSLTFGAGSTNAGTTAWWAMLKSGIGGLNMSSAAVNAGVTGETSAMMLARMPAVLAAGCDVLLLVNVIENDADQLIAASITESNIRAIINKAKNAGMRVVLGNGSPRKSTVAASVHKRLAEIRLRVQKISQDFRLSILDTFSVLSDPATGYMLDAVVGIDDIHYNDHGHFLVSEAVKSFIKRDAFYADARIVLCADPLNYVTNPLMQGGTTLPAGYSQHAFSAGTTNTVYSTVGSDGTFCKSGKSLSIAWNASTDGAIVVAVPVSGSPASGDAIALTGSLTVTDTSGNYASAGCNSVIYYTEDGQIKFGVGDEGRARAIGPVYQKGVSAGGSPGALIWVTVKAGTQGVIKVCELGIINETAAGVSV